MIFLDTSGAYALSDRRDAVHDQAVEAFKSALSSGEGILIHSYVLTECAALLQKRLGIKIAIEFLEDARQLAVVWVDEDLHDRAVAFMSGRCKSDLSLVDAVSFQVMTDMGITKYLGFDKHFSDAGFSQFSV
jgi:predicted nucleic acid-binding protein